MFCSFRYSSLDRKSQKNKIRRPVQRGGNPPVKSSSLGNFNFLNKQDDSYDAVSIASGHSDQRNKPKEKQW